MTKHNTMSNFFCEKNSTFVFIASGFFIFFGAFLLFQNALAGAAENVSGFAWSENIGWLSFNSSNCDTDNNGQSNGGTGCPAAGTPIANYGVSLDANGILSGYAWSENIGWVSFNRPDTGTPPAAPDYGTYLAKVDLSTKEISGWTRVLSACQDNLWNGTQCTGSGAGDRAGGWDGWLKLRGPNYGTWLDDSVSPAESRNWGWSDVVMGWVSFNCIESGICATSTYKVVTTFSFNAPPQANGSAIEYQNYCNVFVGQGQIGFRWTYQDSDNDNEIRFDFKVNDVNDVNNANPEIDRSYSGLSNPSGTVNTQSSLVKSPLEADKLEFGKTYYWWVRVYDSTGRNSGWVAGPSFQTPQHAYPWIDFSWSPSSPRTNEATFFSDNSTVYSVPNSKSWYWTFEDGDPVTSSIQNPTVKFTSPGDKRVTLNVTDQTGYSCTIEKITNTQIPLPDWREIIPFSKVWKFIADIPELAKILFINLDLGYFVR